MALCLSERDYTHQSKIVNTRAIRQDFNFLQEWGIYFILVGQVCKIPKNTAILSR